MRVVGSVAAWYLSATAKAFLFSVQATDPRAFVAALLLLAGAALLASAMPARRAATRRWIRWLRSASSSAAAS